MHLRIGVHDQPDGSARGAVSGVVRVPLYLKCDVCGWEYTAWFDSAQESEVRKGEWKCGPCGAGVLRLSEVRAGRAGDDRDARCPRRRLRAVAAQQDLLL